MAMFGKSRKFQAGKQAKKAAEALIIQREYARSMQEKSGGGEVTLDEESKAAQKAEEERNLRGPSLMEEHLAKRAKHDHSRGKERTPFDREKVIITILTSLCLCLSNHSFDSFLMFRHWSRRIYCSGRSLARPRCSSW